jgi:hypothetical protein
VTHKQALGLLPRKGQLPPKKVKKPKDAANQELKALVRFSDFKFNSHPFSKKLHDILNSEGILHSQYVLQMKALEKAKTANNETTPKPEEFVI